MSTEERCRLKCYNIISSRNSGMGRILIPNGSSLEENTFYKIFPCTSADEILIQPSFSIVYTELMNESDPLFQDSNSVRIDPLTRKYIKVKIGDTVEFEKIDEVVNVTSIVLENQKRNVPVSDTLKNNLIEYIKSLLINKQVPVQKGNDIVIQFGGKSYYKVKSVTGPPNAFLINTSSNVDIEFSDKNPEIPYITYDEIGGLKEEIKFIRENIEIPFKYKELYNYLGIKPIRGMIFYGPPGCGKTLVAKALANELDLTIIYGAGPELFHTQPEIFERNIHALFDEAQKNSPSLIIIDEFDGLCQKRDETSSPTNRAIVSSLLSLLDGISELENIIVIAITNQIDTVDEALRRPGRFDEEIFFSAPNKEGRKEILEILTYLMPIDNSVNFDEIAENTPGFVGADLSKLVKRAAMNKLQSIMRENQEEGSVSEINYDNLKVTRDDFFAVLPLIKPSALREFISEIPKVKFDDIGGLDSVKALVKNMITMMKKKSLFAEVGIQIPKGMILYGLPGTGKTLLAKALANLSNMNFLSIKGPEIFSKWLGESEKSIRAIFRKAREVKPCIIFIDELDSIGSMRGSDVNTVYDKVVNQLLNEMDGINQLEDIIVVGATNRIDLIDEALVRPGRFGYLVEVPLPNKEVHLQILEIKTRKLRLADDVNLEDIARVLEENHCSGAHTEQLVQQVLIDRINEDEGFTLSMPITQQDFETVLTQIIVGLRIHGRGNN